MCVYKLLARQTNEIEKKYLKRESLISIQILFKHLIF